jgi:hypothetical protein
MPAQSPSIQHPERASELENHRRLAKLREKQALLSIGVDPAVSLEIEDIERLIQHIER